MALQPAPSWHRNRPFWTSNLKCHLIHMRFLKEFYNSFITEVIKSFVNMIKSRQWVRSPIVWPHQSRNEVQSLAEKNTTAIKVRKALSVCVRSPLWPNVKFWHFKVGPLAVPTTNSWASFCFFLEVEILDFLSRLYSAATFGHCQNIGQIYYILLLKRL